MRLLSVIGVFLLCCAPALADDISGTWTGPHRFEILYCDPDVVTAGTSTFIITQNGNAIAATYIWKVISVEGCQLEPETTYTLSFTGTVSGNTFTGDVSFPGFGVFATIAGSVSGDTMTFTVTDPPPNETTITGVLTRVLTPDVVLSSFPAGMLQPPGTPTATDSFSLTNKGSGSATVTLVPAGGFFTLDATSLTLLPRETRTVTITATSAVPGAQEGTIAVSGEGVAVRPIRVVLLTAVPPPQRVRLVPPARRTETVAQSGQTAGSGSVSFTNDGAATVQAIAVADVPWLVPQSGIISLHPTQTVAVTFTIDRTKRSDAAAPLGAESGKLSLRFIDSTNTAPAAASIVAFNGTGGGTTSTTIVDVVHPGTIVTNVPPNAPGEVISFITGLGSLGEDVVDLLLASRDNVAPSGNVHLYFVAPGSTRLLDLTQKLGPTLGVLFPAVTKNVFGAQNENGSLQFRGGGANGVSVAAVRLAQRAGGHYTTTLPVLRSDQSAAGGDRIILSGVTKSATVHTNVYVQEVFGTTSQLRVDFLDANGLVVSGRPGETIAGGAALELIDAVPIGAAAVRIRNDSAGPGRLAAYALVLDDTSGESWVVTDLVRTTPPAGTFVAPVSGAQKTVSVTNTGTAAIEVTLDEVQRFRRRAASHSDEVRADETLSLAPLQTATRAVNIANGYVRITGPAGTWNASAPFAGPFVPAAGLTSGQSKRFGGVDDSSAATRAAATAGTTHSSLILIETAGQSATVRVTLRFVFGAASKATGTIESSTEVTIGARHMLTLHDISRAVIGSARDLVGDLSNMQVEVAVISGGGRVVALIESADNASGDARIRGDG